MGTKRIEISPVIISVSQRAFLKTWANVTLERASLKSRFSQWCGMTFFILLVVGVGTGFTWQSGLLAQPDTTEQSIMNNTPKQPVHGIPEQSGENRTYDFWARFERHAYGPDPQQYLYLYRPERLSGQSETQDKAPLAVLVHGGNYLFGSATEYSMMPLADYMMKWGYAVASINYRTLQHHRWPAPVTDVRDGIYEAQRLLRGKVQQTMFVGYSAGAVTGALLLYADQYGHLDGIDRFIGISGLYDKAAASPDPVAAIRHQSLGQVDLLKVVDTIKAPKRPVPALLIEGRRDYFADNFPGTPRSHAERLARLLQQHHIPARTFWTEGEGFDGHDGPIAMLALKERAIIAVLDSFLQGQESVITVGATVESRP
ncbi:MAG: esterase/lipase [Vampirovibrio sp.]|jgi:acetyl esterase/lipase|nr:esterase/lipase [Vampirovibrio sp.]